MQSEKPVFQGRIMRKVLLDKQTAIEYTSNSLNIKQSVGKARTCLKTEASFGFQAGGCLPRRTGVCYCKIKNQYDSQTEKRESDMTTRIIGIGSYVPDTVVTNKDLMEFLDTDDAWIRERTGICERRVSKEMGTCALAVEAAKRAVSDAGIDPKEIDLIVLATSSGDRAFPAAAMDVQAAIGAVNAVGFDITAACSGFIFGLHIAHSFFMSGIYKTALIVGAEALSKVVDWTDRGTCILFGDGAGAAVVRASEDGGIIKTLMGSDGTKGWTLECQARNLGNCLNGVKPELGFMKMDGKEVFKFAVRKVPEIVEDILKEAEMTPEEIKYFVLHQANYRILEAASRRLKIPMEKIPVNIDRYGNTSAASIPILLDEMKQEGKLKRGDKLVLAGFGSGMTWGATLLEW